MKRQYSSPELEWLRVSLSADILAISDPDAGVTTGTGTGQNNPGEDPFGDPELDP